MSNFFKQFNSPPCFGLYKVLASNVEQGVENPRTMLQSRKLPNTQQPVKMDIRFEVFLPIQENTTVIAPKR